MMIYDFRDNGNKKEELCYSKHLDKIRWTKYFVVKIAFCHFITTEILENAKGVSIYDFSD